MTYVGLGKVDNRNCMVLEWTSEGTSLLQDRPSLLQCLSTSYYVLKHSIINLSLFHLKINHQLLGTRGPRDRSHDVSVYETCACVIHTNLLSYHLASQR